MNCLVLFMKTCHLLFVKKKKTVINEWSTASFVMIICPLHSALSPKTEENKSTDLLMYVAADIFILLLQLRVFIFGPECFWQLSY